MRPVAPGGMCAPMYSNILISASLTCENGNSPRSSDPPMLRAAVIVRVVGVVAWKTGAPTPSWSVSLLLIALISRAPV